jgi:hypothetical protein
MSATLDELLNRADRARVKSRPTRAETMRELEETLDELEEDFPDGEPRVSDTWRRLRYATLRRRATSTELQLKHGGLAKEPRPVLTLLRGGRDDA